MKKKGLTIGICFFIIGLIFLTIGLVTIKATKREKTNSNVQSENMNEEKNIYKDSQIIIFDYKMTESKEDIKVSLEVYNNREDTIENTALFLDFYDNSKKVVYTLEIPVEHLEGGKILEVKDKRAVFIYDKITNHKFRFLDINDVPVIEKEEYIKKYGTIDANKIRNSEENVE